MPTHVALALLSLRVPEVTSISTGAAAIAVTVALAIGFYFARWLRAERDEIGARESLRKAVSAMWAARKVLVAVVIVAVVAADLWFRGKGRG
jgi:hypothetical protein